MLSHRKTHTHTHTHTHLPVSLYDSVIKHYITFNEWLKPYTATSATTAIFHSNVFEDYFHCMKKK